MKCTIHSVHSSLRHEHLSKLTDINKRYFWKSCTIFHNMDIPQVVLIVPCWWKLILFLVYSTGRHWGNWPVTYTFTSWCFLDSLQSWMASSKHMDILNLFDIAMITQKWWQLNLQREMCKSGGFLIFLTVMDTLYSLSSVSVIDFKESHFLFNFPFFYKVEHVNV